MKSRTWTMTVDVRGKLHGYCNDNEDHDRCESIKVREVITIDWNKVWSEFSYGHVDYKTQQIRDRIQKLVEKQLRGEE